MVEYLFGVFHKFFHYRISKERFDWAAKNPAGNINKAPIFSSENREKFKYSVVVTGSEKGGVEWEKYLSSM